MARNGRLFWRWTVRTKGGKRKRKTSKRHPGDVGRYVPRAYGDFRDFEDVGGGLEALVPKGDHCATPDPELAEHLCAKRLQELQEAKRSKVVLGTARTARLKEYVAEHLEAKAAGGECSKDWLVQTQNQLSVAIEFFGEDRELASVRPSDVRTYVEHLKTLPNGRGGKLSSASQRHYLNSLSNLFRRAVAEEVVLQNPASALVHKPTPEAKEADFLTAPEAALVLEAAKLYEPPEGQAATPHVLPLVAGFLLTGCRKSELLGLLVEDVSFDRKAIHVRPNEFRPSLKTRRSRRTVPLWPQLEEIWREHVFHRDEPLGELLFPSPVPDEDGEERMLTELRRMLDAVGKLAGFEEGRLRTKVFRHTYCSARLQTLDAGYPVAPFTVSRELGHSSTRMVERVYAHLGAVRSRSEAVEYRVEEFEEELKDRLRELRAA